MSEKSCFYCGSIQNMAVGEAYEVGKSVERERIIKLLEEQDWLPSIKTHIIALIKGEK